MIELVKFLRKLPQLSHSSSQVILATWGVKCDHICCDHIVWQEIGRSHPIVM